MFWGRLEERLMAMLEGVSELSLELLNTATHAWVEQEYQRTRCVFRTNVTADSDRT